MPMKSPSASGRMIAGIIDHTLLKPQATTTDIMALCKEALFYRFASVCVHPVFVRQVSDGLCGSPVRACTVIGFPLGCNTAAVKIAEAEDALANGAQELDMVISIPALKAGDTRQVLQDIRGVVDAARGRPVKVILETHLLTETEKEKACRIVKDAGAQFVKTSTGFTGGGATVDDIRLMRRIVGPDFGVKASGGIRTLQEATLMIEAGANRIGTSVAVTMVT